MALDREGLVDRLREELAVLVDAPGPVAGVARSTDDILVWLAPQIGPVLDSIEQLNASYVLSTVTQGGVIPDPAELDYHTLSLTFVVIGRLVSQGMIELPRC